MQAPMASLAPSRLETDGHAAFAAQLSDTSDELAAGHWNAYIIVRTRADFPHFVKPPLPNVPSKPGHEEGGDAGRTTGPQPPRP